MVRALSTKDTWWFQFPEDRLDDGSQDPSGPAFEIGRLTATQRARITDRASVSVDQASGKVDLKMNRGTLIVDALRMGLKGWRNLPDDEGRPALFTPSREGGAADVSIDMLRPEHAETLAECVTEGYDVTDPEAVKRARTDLD